MKLQVEYDPEVDAAYIPLSTQYGFMTDAINMVVEDDRIANEIVLDFSESGQLLGIEILSASSTLDPILIEKGISSTS